MKKQIIYFFLFFFLFFPFYINALEPSGSLTPSPNSVNLTNPLGNTADDADPSIIIGRVIEGILGLTGVLALVAFVAGGIMWMTSGGSPEKVKKGRDILVWAVLGLFIVFTSYSILKYVFDVLL